MNIIAAFFYGFIWGVETPLHAYSRGKNHNRAVGACYGLFALSIYPVSILVGTIIATFKYWRSGKPTDEDDESNGETESDESKNIEDSQSVD